MKYRIVNNIRNIGILCLWLLLQPIVYGQENDYIIDKSYNQLSWKEFTLKVQNTFPVQFFYNSDSIPDFKVEVRSEGLSLKTVLEANFSPLKINFVFDNSGNIFLSREIISTSFPDDLFLTIFEEEGQLEDSIVARPDVDSEFLQTKKEYVPKKVVIGSRKQGLKITHATVSGFVRNAEDESPIVNGNIYIEELQDGVTTDENGFYSIKLKKGTYTLAVSSLESEMVKYKMELLSNGNLNIELDPQLFLLDEFVVSSDKEHNVRGSQMGFEKLTTKTIKEVPVVLGEKDIIKVALLLPGVQTVGEGSSGFNVRGSPADQNLFYINTVPIYNSSHLFGFFSAFNSDAVSDFSLLKSNIPASYGGRLSSIFDISAKSGNMQHFSAQGGISPITARLVVEGPFKKEKSSYMVGLRSTYSDWILKMAKDPDIKNSSAYFGDAIANFTIKPNAKNEIKLCTYYSYDDANIAGLTQNTYQNLGASIGWNHLIKEKHSLSLNFTTGNYEFEEQNMEYDQFAYKESFDLSHNEFKASFTLRPNEKHAVTFGLNSILYDLAKGDFLPLDEGSSIIPKQFEPERGIESGFFISDQWDISPALQINAGLRFNTYSYLGPKTVYAYGEGLPKTLGTITDTLYFGNNDVIKTYNGLDYRLGARFAISDNLSLKGSYTRIHQYVFMLTNTIAISPTDEWKLCDYNIEPMIGDQVSLGVYSNIVSEILEVSVEGYFKNVKNLVEYKDGAEMVANEIPEIDVIQGNLKAYGIEFMIKKPLGRLSGWINYTYSRAMVKAFDDITGEENNFGNPYPANYDKPHALNFVANYWLTKRLSVSGNIVYSTGRPITYPTAIYYQNGMKLINYSVRNEYRLPDYFRIDLSVNIEGNLKARKFAHGSWNISVYNLLGRKNAYSVYFKSENGQIKGYKLSIFGSPIFSVTYNFKLGNYDN